MARVVKIDNVIKHPSADALDLCFIGGWQVISKTGDYEAGDLAVFCEVDSFVPTEIAPFLTRAGHEPKEYNGVKGERLKTIRLRGELSQGLLLKIDYCISIKGCWSQIEEEVDVSEWLGIQKYEPPERGINLSGDTKGNFPSEFPKTDQERIQNLSRKLEEWIASGEEFEVTEKLEGCFLRTQCIETWDGETVTIGDIVKKGIRPKLIGVDEKGEVVPCEITQVFNNGIKNQWLDVIFEPYLKSGIVGKSGKIRTTPNHVFFLKDFSEVAASELKQGDEILMQENQYCEKAMHYFRSSLLGDGYVGTKGHFSYNECHSVKHQEYMNYIFEIFKNVETSSRLQLSGKNSLVQHFKVFSTTQLRDLRSKWYPDDTKTLPQDISWIDDFTVAKWYMDDGSLGHNEKQNDRANFSTNAFKKEDVERLAQKLRDMYGVSVTVYFSKGWAIRVNYAKATINEMWKRIAVHIPSCMRYKLPEEFRNVAFLPYGNVKKQRQTKAVKVVEVVQLENNKKNFPTGSVGYDLETSTHNYFCGGVLVHNSSMTCYLMKDGTFGVCSRNLDLKRDENNTFWKAAINYNIEQKMKDFFGENPEFSIALQGELIGPGIQGNIYKLQEHEFRVFDIVYEGGEYTNAMMRQCDVKMLGLLHTPVLHERFKLLPMQEILDFADGKSTMNSQTNREGLVFKSLTNPSVSFKVISNEYLLKQK